MLRMSTLNSFSPFMFYSDYTRQFNSIMVAFLGRPGDKL